MSRNRVDFMQYSDGSVEALFHGNVPHSVKAKILQSFESKGMIEILAKRDRTCDMFYFDLASGPTSRRRSPVSKKSFDIGAAPANNQPWLQHKSIPKADANIPAAPTKMADIMARDLARLMLNKSIMSPTPPPQPTDEQLFGHLVPSEAQIREAEQNWSGAGVFNSWIQEATKPLPGGTDGWEISKEAEAYWDSIKIKIDDEP